jgi:kinesin family protein 15
VVASSFQGYNSCVFAYGQTGSGKTHTMLGELGENHTLTPLSGLIPRIFDQLLREVKQRSANPPGGAEVTFECHVSLLEIYNESIMDLLHPELCNLSVREDANRGVYVESLSRIRVHTGATEPQASWLDIGA